MVRVVDYEEQVLVAGFKSWFGGILCLDWSPDGRYLVTGGEVRRWIVNDTHVYAFMCDAFLKVCIMWLPQNKKHSKLKTKN